MDNSIGSINSEISTSDANKQSTTEFSNVVVEVKKDKLETSLYNTAQITNEETSDKTIEHSEQVEDANPQSNFTFEELFPFEKLDGLNSIGLNIPEFFSGAKGEKRKDALEMLIKILESSNNDQAEINNTETWKNTI